MSLSNSDSRKEIYLPSLSTVTRSKTYLIFDVETNLKTYKPLDKVHIPKLICAKVITLFSSGECVEERSCIFWRVKDFHFWVYEQMNKYYTLHILAHNTGYDISTARLWDLFDHVKAKCNAFNPQMGSYYINMSTKQNKIIVVDSMNWFNTSLKKVGDSINFKKGKMPNTKLLDLKWLKYCMLDVQVVIEAMKKLSEYLSEFDLGDLRITNASISFTIFRKHFHSTNLLTTLDLDVLELEYASYYGGRTEMFKYGKLPKQEYYYYDFNSLYPSVMVKNLYSTKLRRHFEKSDLNQLKRFIKNYGCIAKVKIKTNKPYFPKKIDEFTAFPIGVFDTVLSTPELKIALKENMIIKVYNLSVYQQKELFTDFVSFFHAKKQQHKKENNKVWTQFDKLILNSLYGKFGQKIDSLTKIDGNHKEKYLSYDLVDIDKGTIEKRKIINHILYSEKRNVVSTYSIPSIATEVTSYARVKMLTLFNKIGWDNVYYCDTDSVITNEKGMKIIKEYYEGHKLGDLELEDQSNNVSLHALKDYNFGKTERRKSIPANAKQLSKNTYSYIHWNTTIESMRNNDLDGMHTITRKKTLSRIYSKGRPQKDGSILPLLLDE